MAALCATVIAITLERSALMLFNVSTPPSMRGVLAASSRTVSSSLINDVEVSLGCAARNLATSASRVLAGTSRNTIAPNGYTNTCPPSGNVTLSSCLLRFAAGYNAATSFSTRFSTNATAWKVCTRAAETRAPCIPEHSSAARPERDAHASRARKRIWTVRRAMATHAHSDSRALSRAADTPTTPGPRPNRVTITPGPGRPGRAAQPSVAARATRHYHRHMPDSVSPRLRPEPPTPAVIADIVTRALLEDLAGGDITSDATVSPEVRALGVATTKAPLLTCGSQVAQAVFRAVDPTLEFETLVHDGSWVPSQRALWEVRGSARSILMAERT